MTAASEVGDSTGHWDPDLIGAWNRDVTTFDPYEYVPGKMNRLSFQGYGQGSDWWREPEIGPDYTLVFKETTRSFTWTTRDGVLSITYDDHQVTSHHAYRITGDSLLIQFQYAPASYERL